MEVIPKGETIVILDLVISKRLNLTHGTILKWNEEKQRYAVKCKLDNVNRLIKPDNVYWVKIREGKPIITDNTITLFIRANSKYYIDFTKLIEILLFPPSTKYNKDDYFNIENQRRGLIDYIVITIKKEFAEKVLDLAKKFNFIIVEGVPIIKVINGKQVKELNTKSKISYELKSEIEFDEILKLNRKDVDEYLKLLNFNNVVDWLHYYFPDKKNITKNMIYYGIMGFINGRYCPIQKEYVSCKLPDYFFM